MSLVWKFPRKPDLLVIFSFCLLFDLEDEGSMFLRNVGKEHLPDYESNIPQDSTIHSWYVNFKSRDIHNQ
jgi:hypothetical protein